MIGRPNWPRENSNEFSFQSQAIVRHFRVTGIHESLLLHLNEEEMID